MRYLLLLVTGTVLGGGAAAAQSPASRDVVEAFHTALAAGDTAAALTLLTADAIVYESGNAESREEYQAHHLAADMDYAAGTTRRVTAREERMLGDGGVALVLSQIHTTGEFRGRTVDRASVETMVLRRTPGGWRIVHIHWSARR